MEALKIHSVKACLRIEISDLSSMILPLIYKKSFKATALESLQCYGTQQPGRKRSKRQLGLKKQNKTKKTATAFTVESENFSKRFFNVY